MKIELQNISFCYKQFAQNLDNNGYILKNINLKIDQHEIIGIVGASGSGKTTLIQMLNGLLEPDIGTVLLDNIPAIYSGESANNWHKQVGIVFQFPEMQFFENSIFDEISYALRNLKIDEDEIIERVTEVAKTLEFPKIDMHKRSPFHLSEGQKRRVAIASLLVLEPEILIFDEPTAGLDYSGITIIKRIIERIYHENKIVIIVSHDMDFVAEISHRIVALSGGEIINDSPKENFFINENLLSKSHLELPHIMKLAKELRRKGNPIKYPVFSIQELQASLKK